MVHMLSSSSSAANHELSMLGLNFTRNRSSIVGPRTTVAPTRQRAARATRR